MAHSRAKEDPATLAVVALASFAPWPRELPHVAASWCPGEVGPALGFTCACKSVCIRARWHAILIDMLITNMHLSLALSLSVWEVVTLRASHPFFGSVAISFFAEFLKFNRAVASDSCRVYIRLFARGGQAAVQLRQDECRDRASQVVQQMSSDTVLSREELIEALCVATWGGLTKSQLISKRPRGKMEESTGFETNYGVPMYVWFVYSSGHVLIAGKRLKFVCFCHFVLAVDLVAVAVCWTLYVLYCFVIMSCWSLLMGCSCGLHDCPLLALLL